MRKFFITACFVLFAIALTQAQPRYDSLWKKVERFSSEKGLPQSALDVVNQIYLLAKKENQQAQVIKALVTKAGLQANYDEDNDQAIILLRKEISTATGSARSILYSLLGEAYFNYYQQNRYKLIGRTTVSGAAGDDVKTWSFADLHEHILSAYLLSLKYEAVLQKTLLAPYDPIIVKGNARYLRPTLYDLLANRALDYLRNEDRNLIRPAYAFTVDDPNYFLSAQEFARLKIVSSDSLSPHHKALLICQQLLLFHEKDAKPDAFIDADIMRIQLVRQFGVMDGKDALYLQALENLGKRFPLEPAAAKAMYLAAFEYLNKARQYDPFKDTTNRYGYLKAEGICNAVLKQPAESDGKSNCKSLLQEITRQSLTLETEKVNLPGEAFRSSVSYRNVANLYLRVIRLSDSLKENFANSYDQNYWPRLTALRPVTNWEQRLPATNDRQQHRTEIKVDALPAGTYLILASTGSDFSLSSSLAASFIYVSAISYVKDGDHYFVVNRQSGKPLEKAAVQIWKQRYDYTLRKNILEKSARLETDEYGHFAFRTDKTFENLAARFEIRYQADRLFTDDQLNVFYESYDNSTASPDSSNARLYLFSDRAIYRPGQTVYFKGILLTRGFRTKNVRSFAGQNVVVTLRDVNNQKLDSLVLETNEFGSCAGHFTLPKSVLTGQFRLESEPYNESLNFSVEEYKRPKFKVELARPEGIYKVEDSVTVKGSAKAFAGNALSGATVKYRITRQPRLIYDWLGYKSGFPRTSSMEIASGVIKTNDTGGFKLTFKAIPDRSIKKEWQPVFDYHVTADITDINGETQSDNIIVPISYKALQIHIQNFNAEDILKDSLNHIRLLSQNFNGMFVASKITLSFYPLDAPKRLIRKRYWARPDEFVMTRDEFARTFPLDEYESETDHQTWKRLPAAYTITDSSRSDGQWQIRGADLKEGWYALEAVTHDRYGEEVRDLQYLRIIAPGSKDPSYLWHAESNDVLEPGSGFISTIGSSAGDLFLFTKVDSLVIDHRERPLKLDEGFQLTRLTNETKAFRYSISEKQRGGFGISHFFVKDNRFYVVRADVEVPWSNKDLVISYETFRDKTLPGSLEKWKLKVSGRKADKVAAEMLASMYDASLDQFTPQQWQSPNVWPTYVRDSRAEGVSNFFYVNSHDKPQAVKYNPGNPITYDRLISFPGSRFGSVEIAIRGRVAGLTPKPEMSETVVIGYGKSMKADLNAQAVEGAKDEEVPAEETGNQPAPPDVPTKARTNFNETAFFFPQLYTDSSGNIEFSFNMPEALTKWKLQLLAHTKEAAFGYSTKEVITQKDMMVQPNPSRFLREGDHMELSTKIANMGAKEITGTVHLQLFDAITLEPLNGRFQNVTPDQYFTVGAGESVAATFSIQVPFGYTNALVYRFTAESKSFPANLSDGEEAILPVLTNSILVTEAFPLPVKGTAVRKFRLDKLLNSGKSETMKQQGITVEFTSNPAWYAVMSLPYLADNSFHCSERVFNQYYANRLAASIASSSPRIRETVGRWNSSPSGFASNLQKNQELKSVLLEETPWLMEGKNDSVQHQNVAKLFEDALLDPLQQSTLTTLKQYQTPNGGFSWFIGGKDDRFITQYILSGLGHLKQLEGSTHLKSGNAMGNMDEIFAQGIHYLDKRIEEDYAALLKSKTDLKKLQPGYLQIQYLYLRSFFPAQPVPASAAKAVEYFRQQAAKNWVSQNRMMQGMIALIMSRSNNARVAKDVLRSLKETSIHNDELGAYWKDVRPGYFWYQAPVETQSLLIEAFTEIAHDNEFADELRTWLIKQKQTSYWPSTKATADACYALLIRGSDWLSTNKQVDISLGDTLIKSSAHNTQGGTGYFKTKIEGGSVRPEMGNIQVSIVTNGADQSKNDPAWGAVYWQYFERIENLTPSATAVQMVKKMFIEKNSDRGPVLVAIREGDAVKIGDKIRVRVELRVDRDLEYVQLKDMRASAFEPANVLSGYKWSGGLGYYQATGDASTSFFFDRLPRGTHVFEYSLLAAQKGNFSNGITTVQCLYAPEFTSHSEGIRVNVE